MRFVTLKQMIVFTLILLLITLLCLCLYSGFNISWILWIYLTFLTTFYHFAMRLIVGETINIIYKNKEFKLNSIGFRIRSYETRLYKILNVKKWKKTVITAKKEKFDIKSISIKELLHNILVAELVHRVIMILSFLPVLLIFFYGSALVFILTSIFASLIDLPFVIIQRYNRPRVIKLLEHCEKKQKNKNVSQK